MDGERAHPLLAQIPLIVSPFYNPPKPVTLSYNYKPLPPQLPETNVTQDNLEAWITECGHVKEEIKNYGAKEKEAYQNWHETVVRKLAPGYIGGSNTLLTPHRRVASNTNCEQQSEQQSETTSQSETPQPPQEPLNDIDRAFSTLDVK